jgi:isopenicillin-N N-acyltransferase-like protein
MNTNCMFPLIKYENGNSNSAWGEYHGENFRGPIRELSQIRRELMLAKNPKLKNRLDELAIEQFNFSKVFAPHIASEILGIAAGSNLSLTDIVILNNYTDFRDIILSDEGCSTVHIQTKEKKVLAGQTWDMHRSAKNYMCLLTIPKNENHEAQIILTLVGCVGLMGVSTRNNLIGVNNINTTNAKTGLIWPLLVRKVSEQSTLEDMRTTLIKAPVTSGHNYLISSPNGGELLEVTPSIYQSVGKLNHNEIGAIFHTNHCLGSEIEKIEDKKSMSSTTFNRYDLLTKKVNDVSNLNDFKALLTNHDEFPKSICSHFENGAQDPSFTCGGGASDLTTGEHIFWRGCPIHDIDYREFRFKISDGDFVQIK